MVQRSGRQRRSATASSHATRARWWWAPERVCTYHSADGSTVYADPTFSPRGNAIAFAQDAPGKRADGLYVWSFGNCSGRAKLIARGAVDPDWGPR